jgi:uncharacterized protein with von Willebrand factor type A (vWA) domain
MTAPTAAGPLADRVPALTELCRALRARGLLVGPAESIAAAHAVSVVDASDREDVRLALRALLTSRRADYAVYDELFAAWWAPAACVPAPTLHAPRERHERPATTGARGGLLAGVPSPQAALRGWATPDARAEPGDAAGGLRTPSTHHGRATTHFGSYAGDDVDAIARVAARIARRLTSRPSRRWKPARRGGRLHLPRTMRRALALGDVIELARRERRRRRTKLVVLCDVSGSMDLYSRFLLQLLYALQHAFARVESFAFSTALHRITTQLARGTYREALDRLAREVPGWSGGTRIGESVAAFAAAWPRLVDRRTVVIVLSDGWDTGDPALLADALAALRRRAGRVVWLNPLLGSPGYEPLTRGMQAALPHVDVFAPVHDLESLERLAPHLSL